MAASFLSRVTYAWMFRYVIAGYRKALSFRDLCLLPAGCSCRRLYHLYSRSDLGDNRLLSRCRLVWRLLSSFGTIYFAAQFHRLAVIALLFLYPTLLRLMITFVGDKNAPTWQGVVLAIVMLVIKSMEAILVHRWLYCTDLFALRVHMCMNAAVYRKMLRLTTSVRDKGTANVVNLIAVDAQNISDAVKFMHMFWDLPLIMILCFVFLWRTVGLASLAAIIMLPLLIPFNVIYIGNRMRQLQTQQMKFKDKRMIELNEAISGIKVLKFYLWEKVFEDRISRTRQGELRMLRKAALLNAVGEIIWLLSPYLMSLLTFAAFIVLDRNGTSQIDAATAFVTLSLISLLNLPLSQLPLFISRITQGSASLTRAVNFLNLQEVETETASKVQSNATEKLDETGDVVIRVQDGFFSWSKSEEPILHDISLEIPRGHLVAVVGEVSSGKSTLISALLFDTNRMSGSVKLKGSISYVPQTAWLMATTIKENILFNSPENELKYSNIVNACCLDHDFNLLPAGDQTKVGDKGTNLSGGQKQRVSLARACYQDADIYLLDDPISAVDVIVGENLFRQVIGPSGLLKYKTRVLITHNVTHLREADEICIMRQGRIVEKGSLDELLARNGHFAQFAAKCPDKDATFPDKDANFSDKECANENSNFPDRNARYLDEGANCPDKNAHCPDEDRLLDDRTSEVSEDESATKTKAEANEITSNTTTDQMKSRFNDAPVEKHKENNNSTRHKVLHLTTNVELKAEPEINTEVRQDVTPNTEEANVLEISRKPEVDTDEEALEEKEVGWSVIWTYLKSAGVSLFAITVIAHALFLASQVATNIWLSAWANDVHSNPSAARARWRLTMYAVLGFLQLVCILVESVTIAYGCVNASRGLHSSLLASCLRAPLVFYDTTPIGRILNRFSKDLHVVDSNLPIFIRHWLYTLIPLLSSVIAITYTTPTFILPVLVVLVVFLAAQRVYIMTIRQLKRIEAQRKSITLSHVSDSVVGALSIRAYGKDDVFTHKFDRLVDEGQRPRYMYIMALRWMGLYMELLGACIVFVACLFAVLYRKNISEGLAGLSINYALQMTAFVNITIRFASELEAHMVSVERIDEYMRLPAEADRKSAHVTPPSEWPRDGRIQFNNYSTRYRPELDLVLNDVSLTVHPAEKIGIVGRTCAGKSSLALSLFRLLEADSGFITIDGVRIDEVSLDDLRSKITVIPQDPVIFSSTVRANVDALESHSDQEVWSALEQAHLKEVLTALPAGIEHEIGAGAQMFSVGQRQLLCLARALLRPSRVVILDEVTASVDAHTENLLWSTVQREFSHSCVLAIAHRVHTVVDFDRVMVLDNGRIAEIDTPGNLLRNTRSLFYQLVHNSTQEGGTEQSEQPPT